MLSLHLLPIKTVTEVTTMGTKQQRHLEIVQTIQELRCFVMAMDDETWLMYEAWCLQHGL